MLFFKDEKDYKTVVSALRRELKTLGFAPASHSQMMEVLAKSLGHSTWAALQVAHKRQPVAEAAAASLPKAKEAYDGENVDLQDDLDFKGYRLFNDNGQLDLSAEGELLTGLHLYRTEGTLEDISYNTAQVSNVARASSGELDFSYAGRTEVNWDGQEPRHDRRGFALWWTENSEAISEDRCIIAPEGFDSRTNLLNEEVVEEYDLPVRQVLVDAVRRYLVDKSLVAKALGEMAFDAETSFFGDEFHEAAEAFANAKKSSALGDAQAAAGFCMHVGEFQELRQQLCEIQQPSLL